MLRSRWRRGGSKTLDTVEAVAMEVVVATKVVVTEVVMVVTAVVVAVAASEEVVVIVVMVIGTARVAVLWSLAPKIIALSAMNLNLEVAVAWAVATEVVGMVVGMVVRMVVGMTGAGVVAVATEVAVASEVAVAVACKVMSGLEIGNVLSVERMFSHPKVTAFAATSPNLAGINSLVLKHRIQCPGQAF